MNKILIFTMTKFIYSLNNLFYNLRREFDKN